MIIKFGDGAAPQKSPWLFHHLRYLSIIIFVKVLIFLNIDVVLGSVSHWEGDCLTLVVLSVWLKVMNHSPGSIDQVRNLSTRLKNGDDRSKNTTIHFGVFVYNLLLIQPLHALRPDTILNTTFPSLKILHSSHFIVSSEKSIFEMRCNFELFI